VNSASPLQQIPEAETAEGVGHHLKSIPIQKGCRRRRRLHGVNQQLRCNEHLKHRPPKT